MYLFTLNRQKWVFKGKFELGFLHFFLSLSLQIFDDFSKCIMPAKANIETLFCFPNTHFQQISCTTEKQILATQFVTIRLVYMYIYVRTTYKY